MAGKKSVFPFPRIPREREAGSGLGLGFWKARQAFSLPLAALLEQLKAFEALENGAVCGASGGGAFETVVLRHGVCVFWLFPEKNGGTGNGARTGHARKKARGIRKSG
jgi:hypothetical protein